MYFWRFAGGLDNNAVALKMPEEFNPSTRHNDNKNTDLRSVLASARKALARGDGWDIEPCHYDRLRADCEALGVAGNDLAITVALRQAFQEIPLEKLRRRRDTSYSGLCFDQVLYDSRWQSKRFGRTMYVKFAVNGERIEVFTFHENTE